MSAEHPVIVAKKYKVHKNTVVEMFPPDETVADGIQACKGLNEIAVLEARRLHPDWKEIHYLGEQGVVDYKLKGS